MVSMGMHREDVEEYYTKVEKIIFYKISFSQKNYPKDRIIGRTQGREKNSKLNRKYIFKKSVAQKTFLEIVTLLVHSIDNKT